jgi:lipopolysaccharide transport protein LptA
MANSRSNLWVLGGLVLVFCTALAAQDDVRPGNDLALVSESLTIDRQTNLIQAHRPRITQDNFVIQADDAVGTGVDSEQRSEWRFMGHVRITVDHAVIEAESAVFTFDHNQLQRGELEGSPATFTDVEAAQQKPIRGAAGKLVYDNVERTLRLSGNAWIDKEINKSEFEIRGCDLIYNFDGGVSSGSTDCPEPFRFRRLSQADQQQPPADPPQ